MRRTPRLQVTIPLFLLLALALLSVFLLQHDSGESLPSTRTSGEDRKEPGFQDITLEAGIDFAMQFLPSEQGENFKINLYDHGSGVAVGDINNDGYDDIYLVNQLGRNALYRNKGDGTFENTTDSAGPVGLEDRICVGATFSDYDNDGDQDLFVTSTRGGNTLLQNQGRGTFEDVSAAAGVNSVAHSQTASFFDYDNDGFLDLLVTNTAEWTEESMDSALNYYPGPSSLAELAKSTREYNVLYKNKGNGTFEDVTATAGLAGPGWGGDTAIVDYDTDGYLDVFVTNMFGMSQLYHNDGNGSFSDVTSSTLGITSWGAIGSKFFDFNNDGRFDLLLADMHSDMWMPYEYKPSSAEESTKHPFVTGPMGDRKIELAFAEQFGITYDKVVFGNSLFEHHADGTFKEVSGEAGIETLWPWGIATGDFNNDGYEDVFLPSGMGYPYSYWHNYLMINTGSGKFSDQSKSRGIEPPVEGQFLSDRIGDKLAPRSSRCAATADFDQDGRLDLVVNNFNDKPYYYRNVFPQKNYVSFRLTGTHCNRDAICAVVTLYCGEEVMVRQVSPAGGYLSHSSKTLHFGLGSRENVDRALVRWPCGKEQTIDISTINRAYEVSEAPLE